MAAAALSLTGVGASSALAASGPTYHLSGPYVAGRDVTTCTGFTSCAHTPLSFIITSAGLSADGFATVGNVWQPALPLSWKNGAWQASGTWNVSECANGTLVPTQVTFVLYETSLQGNVADNFSGTLTMVQAKGECGTASNAQEFLYTPVTPSWWSGSCDVNDVPGSYETAEWHGLIACDSPPPNDTTIATGPLTGDDEWQCAELAQRWLYMEFGIPNQAQGNPPGGGETIASSTGNYWSYTMAYTGIPLTLESGSGPLSPGDVISYSDPSTGGHVGIVIRVTATTYTIIEQNVPAGGSSSPSCPGRMPSTR
jgi:CHAP domain